MSSVSVPSLRAVTRPLAELPDLLAFADPAEPLVWTRGDRGCVGVGEALRLVFSGPDRFDRAAAAWREIAAAAEIHDPVRLPGSGLVALGTFAFAATSGAQSVLVVPRLLIARHRGLAWITEVTIAPTGADATATALDPELPEACPVGGWRGAALDVTVRGPQTDAYFAGVREAVRRIDEGALEKVVLARQTVAEIPAGDDLRVPLGRLAERYDDCWTFAVDGLIGASPETLIRSTGGAVSARVLAGTRARVAGDASADGRARDELLTSAKDQHEHAFAVQSVVTALAPHVRSLHTSEEPFALRLPNVWHLATDLGAGLGADRGALELVGALHPTAAVAGTPTGTAIETIAELEPFDRGRYSGAVGWIDAAGDGEWVIALRCGQLESAPDGTRTLTATAGGGIVAGSDPEHEFVETVSKFRPVVEAFSA